MEANLDLTGIVGHRSFDVLMAQLKGRRQRFPWVVFQPLCRFPSLGEGCPQSAFVGKSTFRRFPQTSHPLSNPEGVRMPESPMSLADDVAAVHWHHVIALPGGVVTPGGATTSRR